jgi:uncharacterized protein (TIGR03437 family)
MALSGWSAQPPPRESNGCTPVPIPIPAGSQVCLELFATGIRNHVSSVECTVFGQNLPVFYAGAQGQQEGVDQINAEISPECGRPRLEHRNL